MSHLKKIIHFVILFYFFYEIFKLKIKFNFKIADNYVIYIFFHIFTSSGLTKF